MKPSTFLVSLAGVLFALSLVANIMTMAQLRQVTLALEGSGKQGPSTRARRESPRATQGSDPRLQRILEEIAILRQEVRGQDGRFGAIAPSSSPASLSGPPPATAAIVIDPEVETVLVAQSRFRRFWNELNPVFDAKDKLDPEKFRKTVLDSTIEYLQLAEPTRTLFLQESEVAVAELSGARREYYDGRAQLPPKDQNRALYDQQRKALSDRYKERRNAAVDRVTRLLDPSSHSHKEFTRRTEKWLREMRP